MARRCLICAGPGPMTREHVLGIWLMKALESRGRPLHHLYGREYLRTSPKSPDIVLKNVCEKCNHGWLHDLDGAFRAALLPAMRGRAQVLAQPVQQVAATWAVKTWFLAEFALKSVRGGAPEAPHLMPYMRSNGQPPPEIKVWIGAFTPEERSFFRLGSALVGEPPTGISGFFVIGALVFSIWVPLIPGPRPGVYSTASIEGDNPLAPYLTQIWPHEVTEVRLPPARVFTMDDIEALWPK